MKLILLLVACCGTVLQTTSACADGDLEKLVDETHRRLTDEERVVQISGVTAGVLSDENSNFDAKKAAKRFPHGIGHVCQFACNRTDEPESIRKFVADLQEHFVRESSSHIPAICHEEVISGLAARTATTYPQQIGIACTWNAPLLERKCRETSEAMRAVGVTFALSPMADVIVNSNWTRLEEGYGECCNADKGKDEDKAVVLATVPATVGIYAVSSQSCRDRGWIDVDWFRVAEPGSRLCR